MGDPPSASSRDEQVILERRGKFDVSALLQTRYEGKPYWVWERCAQGKPRRWCTIRAGELRALGAALLKLADAYDGGRDAQARAVRGLVNDPPAAREATWLQEWRDQQAAKGRDR